MPEGKLSFTKQQI